MDDRPLQEHFVAPVLRDTKFPSTFWLSLLQGPDRLSSDDKFKVTEAAVCGSWTHAACVLLRMSALSPADGQVLGKRLAVTRALGPTHTVGMNRIRRKMNRLRT
jgi:hypothetical protein